jgi:hypothetical protein
VPRNPWRERIPYRGQVVHRSGQVTRCAEHVKRQLHNNLTEVLMRLSRSVIGAGLALAIFALSVTFRYEGWLMVDDLRLDDPATPSTLLGWARERPTFVVVSMPHKGPRPGLGTWSPGAQLVLETRKPDGTLCDQVYALCPGGCP